jgi:hypothetical protein
MVVMGGKNGKIVGLLDMQTILKVVLAGCAVTLESTGNLPCKKRELVNVKSSVKKVDYILLTE